MFIKRLLIFNLIFQTIVLYCSKGCLKCQDEECVQCDFSNQYFLYLETCYENSIELCEQYNVEGQCEKCGSSGFLNSENECTQIYTDNLIDNCQSYESISICSQCKEGYQLIEDVCVALETNIIGCVSYENSKCIQCDVNYRISDDGLICNELTASPNCVVSSEYQCVQCKDGYFMNRNNYLTYLFSVSNQEILFDFYNIIKGSDFSNYRLPICIQKYIENCDFVNENDFSKCDQCSNGFYLLEGTCYKNPLEPIPNCKDYQNQTTCINCQTNYYLKSSTECVEIIPIDNCSLYSSSASTSKCIQCLPLYYLSNDQCVQRDKSLQIEFCIFVDKTADVCAECQNDYKLSSDQTSCILNISNCQTFNGTTCTLCQNGYYLVNNFCIVGTIENCLTYNTSQNVCNICKNKYYLEANKCLSHQNLQRCDVYSQSIKDRCSICIQPSILFEQRNTCIKQTEINFCEEYQKNNGNIICANCKAGYAYNQTSIQCEIYNDENCIEISSQDGQCVKCDDGYFLSLINTCVEPYSYISNNCQEILKNSETDLECKSCKQNSYPFLLDQMEICLEYTQSYVDLITNCLVYQYNAGNSTFECRECQTSLYLDKTTGQCLYSCQGVHSLVQLNFDGTNWITSKNQLNECLTGANATPYDNCEKIIQVSEANTDYYECILCKEDSRVSRRLPVINTSIPNLSHISMFSRIKNLGATYFPQLKSQFVSCDYDANATVNYNTQGNTVEDEQCDLFNYSPETTQETINSVLTTLYWDVYGCQRCEIGYTGISQSGYIDQCSKTVLYCDTISEIKNLLSPHINDVNATFSDVLQNFASCFACSNNKIPVLFLTSTFEHISFTFLTVDGVHQQCLDIDAESFGLDPLTTFDSIVNNCGYVLYFTDLVASADISNTGRNIICAACKPGYQPTYTSDLITACTEIPNCNLSSSQIQLFNGCSECAEGFQFEFNFTSKTFDYLSCIAINQENCNLYNTSTSKCELCDEGYYLNKDGQCEEAKFPLCYEKYFKDSTFPYLANLKENIYRATLGHGCSLCEQNYKIVNNKPICLSSDYLAGGIFSSTTSYINYCVSYFTQDVEPLKCQTCDSNYVLSLNQSSCYPIDYLQHCKIAVSVSSCSQCDDDYILVSGQCVEPIIDFCESYQYNTSNCLTCIDEYYLENNQCLDGLIEGCKVYQNKTTCAECLQNYHLITKNGGSYCYPIPAEMNCSQLDSNLFQNSILNCLECKTQYILSTNEDLIVDHICLQANLISHCKQYSMGNTLSNSNLTCLKCSQNFYLLNNKCIKRINISTLCKEYDITSDTCSLCNSGYFLSDDQTYCIQYPQGIYGCLEYQDKSICVKCQDQFYITDTYCTKLADEELIVNCIEYDSQKNCLGCGQGYAFQNSQCQQILAQNCLTASDVSTCTSCTQGYGLQKDGGFTNCVSKNLNNCQISTDNYPFECITCNTGYYVLNGVCTSVTKSITNCLIFDSATTCSLCQENYVLHYDKGSCFEIPNNLFKNDEYCFSYQQNEMSSCEICGLGYYFDDTFQCQQCSQNSLSSGCMSCNPHDETQCYMCAFGYYQLEENGECIETNPQPEDTSTSNEQKLSILILVILFMIIQ